MINRGRNQASTYVFNSETGKLEKKEKNIKTIESLSKQKNKKIKNLDQIAIQNNKDNNLQPINNIVVITAQDNLIHNYFTYVETSWDAINCLSVAVIKMPKMNAENVAYWTNYTGQLTIYIGNDFVFDYVNSNSYSTEQDAANALTKYWDNSDIKPFFKGEIARIKEFDKDIRIYVDSIGRRFQQKIPDDFRQSFINNQNVRDAFQAICEFLGVYYICPPQVITDNGETETNTQTPSDGQENDVSTQQNTEQNIKNIAKNKSQQQSNDTENNDTQNNDTENSEGNNIENNEEIPDIQNGYGDISFDANGAIVHGSTIIETSPDMAETLINMEENPLEQYLEDETGVVEAVQRFLDGDIFEELHNNVMNYDAITIQPASTTSSDITANTDITNNNTNTNTNGENSNSGNNSGSNSNNNVPSVSQPSSRAIQSHKKPISFSSAYINTFTKEQAAKFVKQYKNSGIYTKDTIAKMMLRMMGQVTIDR